MSIMRVYTALPGVMRYIQQVALSEVHLVRARCPHHKSFIINICTSSERELLYLAGKMPAPQEFYY